MSAISSEAVAGLVATAELIEQADGLGDEYGAIGQTYPVTAELIRNMSTCLSEQKAELARLRATVDDAWAEFGNVSQGGTLAAHIRASLDELAGIAVDARKAGA